MVGGKLFCYVKCTNDLFCNLYLKSQEALGIEGNGKSYCGEKCIWSEGYRERKGHLFQQESGPVVGLFVYINWGACILGE